MTTLLSMTGADLVEELIKEGDSVSVRVMIREAGRIVDRLSKFDALLDGDENLWARVVIGRDTVLEVRVDHVLQEARQQTTVLRHLLAEIARIRGGGTDGGQSEPIDGLDGL